MKDSFILFLEQEQTVDLLSDEQAGKLFKALYDMVRGEKISFDDKLLNMAFIPIGQSIERNIEKYQKICDRNKLNGSQGGRPPKNPVGSLGSQNNPENPDGYSGNPPDPDPDPDPVSEKQYVVSIFEHWKKIHNHPKAKLCTKRRTKINQALKTYSADELIRAIDGAKLSTYHQGQNESKTIYDDIELILRDSKHIESFMKYKSTVVEEKVSAERRSAEDTKLEEDFNRAHDQRLAEYRKCQEG